ncbi:hypothetical protein MAR_030507, partial [Mya arenaria]
KAHVSGNRPELIKRARGLVQIGKRTLKEINIQDNNNKLERQEELFTTPLGKKLPEPGSLKVFYEDGHVHSVKYNQISHKCSHCYVRAKVIPSLPGSDVKKRIMNHGPVCLKYRERFMLLDATVLLGRGNHATMLLRCCTPLLISAPNRRMV